MRKTPTDGAERRSGAPGGDGSALAAVVAAIIVTIVVAPACETTRLARARSGSPVSAPAGRARVAGEPAPFEADPVAARAAQSEANDHYLAGDFARAGEAFRRFSRRSADPLESAWALYWDGRCRLALGRLGSARSSFTAALETAGDLPGRAASPDARDRRSELRAYALAGLADVALAQRRPAESLLCLARIRADRLDGRLDRGGFLFREGAALEALGRTARAAAAFSRLADLWPECELAPEARARAASLGGGEGDRSRIGTRRGDPYSAVAAEFASKEPAEAVAERLRGMGLRARVRAVVVGLRGLRAAPGGRPGGGRRRFVVWLGSYELREEAGARAEEARDLGYPAEVLP